PAFILGVQVGFNFPFSHIQKVYSILDGADYSKKYTPQIGVVSGLHMEWVFMPGLSINADPTYSRSTYSRDITGKNDWKLNYSETFVNYDISGMIRYTYNFHTVRLSVAAGYQYLRIDKAFADLELNSAASTTSGLTTYPSYQLAVNKIDMIQYDLRKRDFGFWVVGAGIAYQTDNFIFSLDARYAYSNKNIVNSEKRYANNQLVMDYFYTDNDFDISRVEARAGVAYILDHKIRPRKIK
ncbi:MAG TPA: hypothetical protein PLU53_09140, partial [Bacteroidia bacterium]|nr:hypothetical protein [Bacteroidia bacterium]